MGALVAHSRVGDEIERVVNSLNWGVAGAAA